MGRAAPQPSRRRAADERQGLDRPGLRAHLRRRRVHLPGHPAFDCDATGKALGVTTAVARSTKSLGESGPEVHQELAVWVAVVGHAADPEVKSSTSPSTRSWSGPVAAVLAPRDRDVTVAGASARVLKVAAAAHELPSAIVEQTLPR